MTFLLTSILMLLWFLPLPRNKIWPIPSPKPKSMWVAKSRNISEIPPRYGFQLFIPSATFSVQALKSSCMDMLYKLAPENPWQEASTSWLRLLQNLLLPTSVCETKQKFKSLAYVELLEFGHDLYSQPYLLLLSSLFMFYIQRQVVYLNSKHVPWSKLTQAHSSLLKCPPPTQFFPVEDFFILESDLKCRPSKDGVHISTNVDSLWFPHKMGLKLGWHRLRFDTYLLPVNRQKCCLLISANPATPGHCVLYTLNMQWTHRAEFHGESQWISVRRSFLDSESLHKGLRAEKSFPRKPNTCGALMFPMWHGASHCSSCFLMRLSGSSSLALLPLVSQEQIRYARSWR